MSDRLTYSRDEVAEMTRSRTRAGQCKFLATNHIKFYRDAHGWPVVLRSTVEGKQASNATPEWKPGKVA